MNVAKIREKYPNSYNALFNWANSSNCQENLYNSISDRFLYDFFDSVKYYVNIGFSFDERKRNCTFEFNILDTKNLRYVEGENNYKTRQDAEKVAFNIAFDFLESELSGNLDRFDNFKKHKE